MTHRVSASGQSIIISNQDIITLDIAVLNVVYDIMKLSQINVELFKDGVNFILRETQLIKLNIEHDIVLDLIQVNDLEQQDVIEINTLFNSNSIKYRSIDNTYILKTQIVSAPFNITNKIIMMISSLSSKESTLSIHKSGCYDITQIHGYQKYIK